MFRVKWIYLLPLFFLAVFLYPVPVLEVKAKKSDQILFLRKVSPGDQFEFQYIHSVEKIPVAGLFVVTPKRLIKPIETQFPSHGPGLPFMGGEVVLEKGIMRAGAEVGEMKQFSFFVSPFTRQSLIFKNQKLDLSTVKEGEVVTVVVKKYPIGRVLFKHGR